MVLFTKKDKGLLDMIQRILVVYHSSQEGWVADNNWGLGLIRKNVNEANEKIGLLAKELGFKFVSRPASKVTIELKKVK